MSELMDRLVSLAHFGVTYTLSDSRKMARDAITEIERLTAENERLREIINTRLPNQGDQIKRLTAERDRLREAMTHAVQSGHNLDCLFCGFKDRALTLALDQKADEDARDE